MILIRVDSQLDDKDLRHKARLMRLLECEDFSMQESMQLIGCPQPYQEAITRMSELLKAQLCPLLKLQQIDELIASFKDIVKQHHGGKQYDLDRADLLSILIYVLVKANIDDLRAQFVLMSEFSTSFVQEGYSRIAATYSDLKNAIDFVQSLDLQQLESRGADYLKNAQIESIETQLYVHPNINTRMFESIYDVFTMQQQQQQQGKDYRLSKAYR